MGEYEVPEKTESRRERVVGLIIATIAVILAVVSALGHETQNEQILAHVDASDQYAFYQAKKERCSSVDLADDFASLYADRLSPAGATLAAPLSAKHLAEKQRLTSEMKQIQVKGDDLMKEAKHLEQKSKVLDLGEIALQISIVLCSITILTEQRLFTVMGVVTAGVGIAVALWGILLA
jgi:hypothetical protein